MASPSPTGAPRATGTTKFPREPSQFVAAMLGEPAAGDPLVRMSTRWIEFVHPYDGAMEDAAKPTLTGDRAAVVVAPYDAEACAPAKWSRVLYTTRAETPDPAATLAAALHWKPAGVILRHELTDAPPSRAAVANGRALRIAELAKEFVRAESRIAAIRRDPRASKRGVRASVEACDRIRGLLLVEVEAAITTGLDARFGFRILPVAVVTAACLADLFLYRTARLLRFALARWEPAQTPARTNLWTGADTLLRGAAQDEWRPDHLAVCTRCTVLFRPRATARLCETCAHTKSSAPPLGYGHAPITDPGDQARISVPRFHPKIDRMIIGYVDKTIGRCPECGAWFEARRSDAVTCPRSACRMRRKRRKM
jgi:hypothetical protein